MSSSSSSSLSSFLWTIAGAHLATYFTRHVSAVSGGGGGGGGDGDDDYDAAAAWSRRRRLAELLERTNPRTVAHLLRAGATAAAATDAATVIATATATVTAAAAAAATATASEDGVLRALDAVATQRPDLAAKAAQASSFLLLLTERKAAV